MNLYVIIIFINLSIHHSHSCFSKPPRLLGTVITSYVTSTISTSTICYVSASPMPPYGLTECSKKRRALDNFNGEREKLSCLTKGWPWNIRQTAMITLKYDIEAFFYILSIFVFFSFWEGWKKVWKIFWPLLFYFYIPDDFNAEEEMFSSGVVAGLRPDLDLQSERWNIN